MKKLFFLLLALPFGALSQEKTLITTDRLFPRADKVQEFETALTAHAKKYHKGDQSWRVFAIQTGVDAGGYMVVEGPMTWDGLDKRGDLGADHLTDYSKTIAPLLTDKTTTAYYVFRADLSSVAMTDYSDKINIIHVYPKPGYGEEVDAMLVKLKKVWEASKQSVAVYESSSSGEPQMIVVIRYKEGLKERERGFRKPMKERYTAAHGDGSWATYQQDLKSAIDHSWSEILFQQAKLGSTN